MNIHVNHFFFVTDSGEKGENSVFTFVNKLVDHLHLPDLKCDEELIFYTDGPSSEFEIEYIIEIVFLLSKKN